MCIFFFILLFGMINKCGFGYTLHFVHYMSGALCSGLSYLELEGIL